MKITANQQFRHGYDTYEADTEHEVTEGLGTYFVMNGWATSDEVTATGEPPADVDLEVDDSTLGHASEVK